MNGFFVTFGAALAGIFVGSVINWLADDLPFTYRVSALHYPDGSRRAPLSWSGLLAYLTGHHISPNGTTKLSWRYPLTELATAMLFAYVVTMYPLSARTLFWWGNITLLMLITVIDLEHRQILVMVIVVGCLFALLGAAIAGPEIAPTVKFADYLIGGVGGFLLFLLMYLGGMLFSSVAGNMRGEEIEEVAFGYGDVLLATLSGLMLGWQALIFAVFIAVMLGGLGALLFLGFRLLARGKYELFTALPYGQYIVLGTLIMMLWRDRIGGLFTR